MDSFCCIGIVCNDVGVVGRDFMIETIEVIWVMVIGMLLGMGYGFFRLVMTSYKGDNVRE